MNTKEKKYGRRFEEEFKRNAVEMLESGARSMKQLGRELGVSACSLMSWKKKYGKGTGIESKNNGSVEQTQAAEIVRLRRELETVSRQRDILKKACAILGLEPWNVSH